MIDANVAIVGAGPAGTAAAARLGQLGVKGVVLLDKHAFPRDKTCGSGLSPKGIEVLRELGVWEAVRRKAYPITGLRLVSQKGREVILSSGDARFEAVICVRRTLDYLILQQALDGGVQFVPHFTATRLLENGGRVEGVAARDGRAVRARMTVIAGGSHCHLVPQRRPRKTIQAIMGWWAGVPYRDHHIEMIFDRMLHPLYGWLFPEGGDRVNIGITYEDPQGVQNARELLQRFLDKHYAQRLIHARRIGELKGHPIVYSYGIEGLTSPGRIVAGESGLLTHPATAEGIYQGLRSGILAAEAARDVIVQGVPEADALAAYERRCRRAFRASFLGGRVFRWLMNTPVLDALGYASERPLVRRTAARVLAGL